MATNIKNAYYYDIYGLCAKSNVQMPLLKEKSGVETYDIEIILSYGEIQSAKSIMIKKENGHYIINLGIYADYEIFSDKIICVADSFNSFFSTVFNIPFAVYFLNKNEKILHCCSMLLDNSLVCFVGEKGVGKSTLTQLLNSTTFELFSDDTLRIDQNNVCYRAHNLIKLTDNTINNLCLENLTSEKNIVGKTYGIIQNLDCIAHIRAIIQVKQNKNIFAVEEITNLTQIKSIYFNHTVGLYYLPSDLFCRALKMKYITDIPFLQIILPQNIE